MPKYTQVTFREGDTKSYTYLTGDVIYSLGDEVLVPAGKGDGERRVFVSGFTDVDPPFACRSIIGMAPPREGRAPDAKVAALLDALRAIAATDPSIGGAAIRIAHNALIAYGDA